MAGPRGHPRPWQCVGTYYNRPNPTRKRAHKPLGHLKLTKTARNLRRTDMLVREPESPRDLDPVHRSHVGPCHWAPAIGVQYMVILDRIRELHDDIVFRHYPDIREHAPLTFSAVFLIILATTLATSLLAGASTGPAPGLRTTIDYPASGAKLRRSRFPGRATATAPRRPAVANGPMSPMLIDIDPESGAVHASAGIIDVHGTPITIGNWPLD